MNCCGFRASRAIRWSLSLAAAMGLGAWAGWSFVLTSPESRALGGKALDVYERLHRVESGRAAVFESDLVVRSVQGLPELVENAALNVRYQAPDRLRLSGGAGDTILAIGRNAEELWVHVPGKRFGLIGSPKAPRFERDPDSAESVTLPSVKIPVTALQLRLLPALLRVARSEIVREDNQEKVPALAIAPSWLAKELANLPEFELHIAFEGEEGAPSLIRFALPGGIAATAEVDNPRIAVPAEDPGWRIPAGGEDVVETVALSHLLRCARVLAAQLDVRARTPPLPPEAGKREVVATSGKGRLEMRDGVRVLFLAGSPAEMGRQHGELLRDEVRRVAERIVYGIGVGSSFAKGQWVLGEIEEAQARVEPFVPAAYLAEMDALADAAGLHRQEARLANFFPEMFHCSGFALHGKATVGGAMYHGRVLDYIRGAGLEDNAVVMVYRPDDGNAWVNVSYAEFVGSVTAMNAKQLAIGEMGGRGEGQWDGKPMAQLVREVMERCDTIEEAVELMRAGPRTCEYYYVISDAKSMRAVGIKGTPDIFETVWSGETHPQLPHAVEDAVILSAGDRYEELVRRVRAGYGDFDADSARDLMTRPVCMESNIQSVLFAPGTLDFWVANADSENVASHTRYTRFNLRELLAEPAAVAAAR